MTMQELYERWGVLIAKPGKRIGEYPSHVEPIVQEAVRLKRSGQYEQAIDLYLHIMENDNACYYDLLVSMYKTVLSSGHFYFAYEVIAAAEILVKRWQGMTPPAHPFFPFVNPGIWRQTELRRELEELMLRHRNFSVIGDINDDNFRSCFVRTMHDLTAVIKPYSGQDNYAIPGGVGPETQSYIQSTLEIMTNWHEQYKEYLN